MRKLRRRLLLPWLRRDEGDVARRARRFAIRTESGRSLVDSLGRAFIGGYNAMLEYDCLADVARGGRRVIPHFRPFFFEGAAMGYLPRCLFDRQCRVERAERDLLDLDPAFRYLYYVGVGFWHGFRHPRRPEALLRMVGHISPLHFPLCFDGYGFKLGFFDFPRRHRAIELLEQAPSEFRSAMYQGFGRALFFVTMDDAEAFDRIGSAVPEQHRGDLRFGHALATGFTGVDRPGDLARYVADSDAPSEREARLTGITWALTARRTNDPDYFRQCMHRASASCRTLLETLPDLCLRELDRAKSYAEWQTRTRDVVVDEWSGRAPAIAELH